jgi:hypothetical protein
LSKIEDIIASNGLSSTVVNILISDKVDTFVEAYTFIRFLSDKPSTIIPFLLCATILNKPGCPEIEIMPVKSIIKFCFCS